MTTVVAVALLCICTTRIPDGIEYWFALVDFLNSPSVTRIWNVKHYGPKSLLMIISSQPRFSVKTSLRNLTSNEGNKAFYTTGEVNVS